MLRVGVVGSRKYKDKDYLFQVLDYWLSELGVFQVVSGGAQGPDSYAVAWANSRKLPVPIVHPADWSNLSHPDAVIKTRRDKYQTKYDALAGFRRNQTIVDDSNVIVAFVPDADNPTKGTADTIKRARDAGKPVYIYDKPKDRQV